MAYIVAAIVINATISKQIMSNISNSRGGGGGGGTLLTWNNFNLSMDK